MEVVEVGPGRVRVRVKGLVGVSLGKFGKCEGRGEHSGCWYTLA